MRKLFGIALLAVAALFVADPGWAAITGSHHDIPSLAKQGSCSACHVPHKAAGKRLWPSNMASLEGAGANGFSRFEVGALCAFCHDALGGQAGTAQTPLPFKDVTTLTHGMDKSRAPDGTADLDQTLPYVATGATMQCTSCHNVHDNANAPFLQRPLDQICSGCHADRQFVNGAASTLVGTWGDHYGFDGTAGHAAGGNPGSHPVGTDVWTDTSQHNYTGTTAADPDSPINVTAIGTVAYWSGTTWLSGAHVINGATVATMALNNGMGCVTCHVVHGKSDAAGNTTMLPTEDVLAVSQGANGNGGGTANGDGMPNNALCELCHRGVAAGGGAITYTQGTVYYPNPGQTNFGHPVDDYYATVEASVTAFPADWPIGSLTSASNPGVICESCHMPHPLAAIDAENTQPNPTGNVATNTHILRGADTGICDNCHTGQVIDHHPVGSGLMDGTQFADAEIGDNDNDMECSDCHNGSGAHNWSAVGAVGLDPNWEPVDNGRGADAETARYQVNTSKECIDCHNANNRMSPTKDTPGASGGYVRSAEYQQGLGDASHYVGTFAAGTWAHFGGNLTESFVTGPWPAGGWSRFGGADAAGAVLVCESCHELQPSRNAPGVGALLLEAYAEGSTETRNALCEGCHSQNATATGAPHPMTGMDITKASAVGRAVTTLVTTGGAWSPANTTGTFADITGAPIAFTTYPTAAGTMNCDSCHQPHNADSNSGTYILETNAVAPGDTAITGSPDQAIVLYGKTWTMRYVGGTAAMDYHLFCNLCHASGS